MEEARRVLERLRRIEILEREGAHSPALLAEVRALLAEAEAWLRAEGAEAGDAAVAVKGCRAALDADRAHALSA